MGKIRRYTTSSQLTYPLNTGNEVLTFLKNIPCQFLGNAILEEGNPICTEPFFYLWMNYNDDPIQLTTAAEIFFQAEARAVTSITKILSFWST